MQLELDLLAHRRLDDEIVESTTDECVGFDVGVGHVVLGSDFVLLGGDLFCCAWVSGCYFGRGKGKVGKGREGILGTFKDI